MKSGIHPTYFTNAKVVCSCGNSFEGSSTRQETRVEICSNCHPVYTGVKRLIDTLGRVDRFKQAQESAAKAKYALDAKKQKNSPEAKKIEGPRTLKDMKDMLAKIEEGDRTTK